MLPLITPKNQLSMDLKLQSNLSDSGNDLFESDSPPAISFLSLCISATTFSPLSPLSALHELYPIIIGAIFGNTDGLRESILFHSHNTAVVERSHYPAIMQFM